MFHSFQRHVSSEFLVGRNPLWTDWPVPHRHPDALPLLERPGGGHEPKLALEHRCVGQAEVDLDGSEVLAGERELETAQSPELRLDDRVAHRRHAEGGASVNRMGVEQGPCQTESGQVEEAEAAKDLFRQVSERPLQRRNL